MSVEETVRRTACIVVEAQNQYRAKTLAREAFNDGKIEIYEGDNELQTEIMDMVTDDSPVDIYEEEENRR